MRFYKFQIVMFLSVFGFLTGHAQTKMIADNSFYIEEAFNQEDHVVQHIFTTEIPNKGSGFLGSFTQEWPMLSQTHQLSLTLAGNHSGTEFSSFDGMVNYRYQWAKWEAQSVYLAPRISILFPLKDASNLSGPGVQVNLPVSYLPNDKYALHFNAGGSYRSVKNFGSVSSLNDYFIGGSIIWMPIYSANIMLEMLGTGEENLTTSGDKQMETGYLINPGVRFAIDIDSLQIVPGISFPFSNGSGSLTLQGVFLYVSFEHPF